MFMNIPFFCVCLPSSCLHITSIWLPQLLVYTKMYSEQCERIIQERAAVDQTTILQKFIYKEFRHISAVWEICYIVLYHLYTSWGNENNKMITK